MLAETVEDFLYFRRGARFCSRCIGNAIGATPKAAFAAANTVRVHRRHLHIDLAACTSCGGTKAVFWTDGGSVTGGGVTQQSLPSFTDRGSLPHG